MRNMKDIETKSKEQFLNFAKILRKIWNVEQKHLPLQKKNVTQWCFRCKKDSNTFDSWLMFKVSNVLVYNRIVVKRSMFSVELCMKCLFDFFKPRRCEM